MAKERLDADPFGREVAPAEGERAPQVGGEGERAPRVGGERERAPQVCGEGERASQVGGEGEPAPTDGAEGEPATPELPPRLVAVAYVLALTCALLPLAILGAGFAGAVLVRRGRPGAGLGVIAVAVVGTALGIWLLRG